MSLELALQENTAALRGVTELLQRYLKEAAAPASASSEKKRKTPPAAPTAPVAESSGDADGTRYWHIAKHNTVYKQLPGMGDCNIGDAVEVTQTEYEVQKALIEQKVSAAAPTAPAAHSAPAVEPTPATVEDEPMLPNFTDVVDSIKQYFRAFGNAEVVKMLEGYGVKRVPELEAQTDKYAEVIAFVQSRLGE